MDPAEVKALHKEATSNMVPMLVNLAGLAACIATLASGWPTGHWAWTAAVIVVLVYFQHCWMTIFHEDVHYTLYKGRWHNIRNGMIVGTLLTVPFSVYRQVHIRHHNKMNMPEDWELWPYCDPNKSLAFRRVFAFFDVLFGVWAASIIYGRIFFVKHSPITDPKTRRKIWMEYGIIAVFWVSIWTWVALTGAWLLFAKIYLIPAFLVGIVQTIRKFTEHLGLPEGDPMRGARTVVTKDPIGKAFSYTSFHIATHGVHHKYPQMPHENLIKAYEMEQRAVQDAEAEAERTKAAASDEPIPVFPSHFRAMMDMTRYLPYPGIGVNARRDRETADSPRTPGSPTPA